MYTFVGNCTKILGAQGKQVTCVSHSMCFLENNQRSVAHLIIKKYYKGFSGVPLPASQHFALPQPPSLPPPGQHRARRRSRSESRGAAATAWLGGSAEGRGQGPAPPAARPGSQRTYGHHHSCTQGHLSWANPISLAIHSICEASNKGLTLS